MTGAGLLRVVAEFAGFDAVALVVVADDARMIQASWPMDRAEMACDDSTEVGRSHLLVAAGGAGGEVVTMPAEIYPGMSVTIHGSLITAHEIQSTVAEQALATLVPLITSHLGAEIARQRLENVSARMASLVDLSLTFDQELSLDVLLTRIVESACKVLGARYAALGVLDETGTGLAEFVTAGLNPEEKSAMGEVPHGRGLLGEIIRHPRAIRLEHMAGDSRSAGLPPNHPPMDSFLGVPIMIRGEVFGNLYLTEKVGQPFTAEDERMIAIFATQAAIAIDNVRRNGVERQRANVLKSVQEIEHAIRATPDTQQALDVLCAALGEGLNADRVIAHTIDDDRKLLLRAQWHLPDLPPVGDVPDDLVVHPGRLADELWQSSERLIVHDLLASEALSERAQKFHCYTGARATIIVPIGLGDRVVGMIYVIIVGGPRQWTQTEADVVQQVGAFVAQVIVESEYRVYQNEYVERLKRLDRQKINFVETVSHELRTPLTLIIGYLELFKDEVAGGLTKEQHQMLEVMDRNTSRLHDLIEQLLWLNRSESDDLTVDTIKVSMGELITNTCRELSALSQDRAIELNIDSGPATAIVFGDREQLESVVINIVTNAIKFSRGGDAVAIKCILEESTRWVRFTCEDHGIGIPAADQGELFTPFYRGSNAIDQQIPGAGLGLSIVKQIVHDHGGYVRLTSVEGEGTTVAVNLPLYAQIHDRGHRPAVIYTDAALTV